jgi:hypothetical protein
VDAAIEQPGRRAERRPDREVAQQQQPDKERRAGPPTDDAGEHEHERRARRQHHGDDHQDPAKREQADFEGDRRGDRLVMEVLAVRRSAPDAE